MKIEDYAVEYAVKKSTNKAFWWNKFDEPKDKREVQKILWKNPVMLLTIISTAMLVFIFCFLVILNGDRLEYYILVAIIEIVFLIPLGLSTRYIITKHYFEEKFERS